MFHIFFVILYPKCVYYKGVSHRKVSRTKRKTNFN